MTDIFFQDLIYDIPKFGSAYQKWIEKYGMSYQWHCYVSPSNFDIIMVEFCRIFFNSNCLSSASYLLLKDINYSFCAWS